MIPFSFSTAIFYRVQTITAYYWRFTVLAFLINLLLYCVLQSCLSSLLC
jgi:hypothetical protein